MAVRTKNEVTSVQVPLVLLSYSKQHCRNHISDCSCAAFVAHHTAHDQYCHKPPAKIAVTELSAGNDRWYDSALTRLEQHILSSSVAKM